MKISNSKKELARIVSENGGWRDGAKSAAQCKSDNAVSFYRDIPDRDGDCWWGEHLDGCDIVQDRLIANWHQSCLSRAEYLHLYPAPDAKPEFCESVMRSIPEPSDKPTIEQLAADYCNAKDYADRKQEEADDAKADAEAKLAELVAAGKAIGLVLGVATTEPELVITDWRDLKVGDEIEMLGDGWNCDNAGKIGVVRRVEGGGYNGDLPILCDIGEEESDWGLGFKFIRRP